MNSNGKRANKKPIYNQFITYLIGLPVAFSLVIAIAFGLPISSTEDLIDSSTSGVQFASFVFGNISLFIGIIFYLAGFIDRGNKNIGDKKFRFVMILIGELLVSFSLIFFGAKFSMITPSIVVFFTLGAVGLIKLLKDKKSSIWNKITIKANSEVIINDFTNHKVFLDYQHLECVLEQNDDFIPICSFSVIDKQSIKLTGKKIMTTHS